MKEDDPMHPHLSHSQNRKDAIEILEKAIKYANTDEIEKKVSDDNVRKQAEMTIKAIQENIETWIAEAENNTEKAHK